MFWIVIFFLCSDAPSILSADQTFDVRFVTDPAMIPLNQPVSLEFYIYGHEAGRPLSPEAEVRFDARMPQHRHGMTVAVNVQRLGPGHFRAAPIVLHMPGLWRLYVDVKRNGVIERAQLVIELKP